jgi:SMI1 / KNR4 family (SUKH-1)
MDIEEFKLKHNELAKGLSIFESEEILEAFTRDGIVRQSDVDDFERTYGVALPKSYIDFSLNFQCGDFGYITILSLDKNGEFFLGNVLDKDFLSRGLVPFADDGSGGYYCFKLEGNHKAVEEIYNIYMGDFTIEKLKMEGFFDFIIKRAYGD